MGRPPQKCLYSDRQERERGEGRERGREREREGREREREREGGRERESERERDTANDSILLRLDEDLSANRIFFYFLRF